MDGCRQTLSVASREIEGLGLEFEGLGKELAEPTCLSKGCQIVFAGGLGDQIPDLGDSPMDTSLWTSVPVEKPERRYPEERERSSTFHSGQVLEDPLSVASM